MPAYRPIRSLLVVLLLVSGCAPAKPTTPAAVVRAYCLLANRGQYPEAAAFLEPSMAQLLLFAPGAPASKLTLLEAECRHWTKEGSIVDVRPLGQRTEGPAAIVDVRLRYRDGTERTGAFALWQTGADWRIVSNTFVPGAGRGMAP